MIGLENVGKTKILYRLKDNELVETSPTKGFNQELVTYKDIVFHIFDIGGSSLLDKFRTNMYENNKAIIYVVDASDSNHIQ